jgi:hypothetical protein
MTIHRAKRQTNECKHEIVQHQGGHKPQAYVVNRHVLTSKSGCCLDAGILVWIPDERSKDIQVRNASCRLRFKGRYANAGGRSGRAAVMLCRCVWSGSSRDGYLDERKGMRGDCLLAPRYQNDDGMREQPVAMIHLAAAERTGRDEMMCSVTPSLGADRGGHSSNDYAILRHHRRGDDDSFPS